MTRCATSFARSLFILLLLSLVTGSGVAGSVTGTANYREQMLLTPEAVFDVSVEQVSRADARLEVIATTRVEPASVQIVFTLQYDDARIRNDQRYAVLALFTLRGKFVFTTDTAYPVLCIDGSNHVDILLLRTSGTSAAPLETTKLEANFLARCTGREGGAAARALRHSGPEGEDAAGSGGCNRFSGACRLIGDRLSFGHMAGTMMACRKGMEQERALLQALAALTSWRVVGQHLDLLDDNGTVVAQFAARAMP